MELNKFKNIMWICLGLCIIMMYSGFAIRVGNESKNKAVICAAEYNEFYKASSKAHLDFDELLSRLKDSKVTALAVKETTLADLSYRGDIFISTVGNFLSSSKGVVPGYPGMTDAFTGDGYANPSSYIIITDKTETAAFLKERLGRRFGREQLEIWEMNGKAYFLLKCEINEKLDVGLGFEEEVLAKIRDKGFDILLRPRNSPGSSFEYLDEYERIINDFNVKYVIFDGNTVAGAPEKLDVVEGMLRKYGVIIGIIEAPSQIRYVEQEGLGQLMAGTGYSINRVYITLDTYLLNIDSEGLFYQWIRGVVDRNIRIIYVNPLRNQKATFKENVENTIFALRQLNDFIPEKGYATGKPLERLSSQIPSALHYMAVSFSLVFASALYLIYLLDRGLKLKYAMFLVVAGLLASVVLNVVIRFDMAKPLALAAAILYPSFSTLLGLRYLKENRGRVKLFKQAAVILGLLLGVNALGMYSIVSTLSDIRYTMNVDLFRGVFVSYVTPMILFMVNFVFVFAGYGRIVKYLIKISKMRVNYLAVALALIGALAFYIYVARSGNTMGVSASSLELKLRELFERTLVARPRFKEFFICYPSLFAMVLLYNRYKAEIIPFLLGIGVAVGSVSMVNSFCHVFTAVSVSAMRTLYGLIIGVVFGAIALLVLKLVIRIGERLHKAIGDIDEIAQD